MKNKIFIALIFIVLLSITAVNAADDATSDIISADDNEGLILDETIDDVSSANDNYDDELILEGTANEIIGSADENEAPKDILSADTSTYSELSNEMALEDTLNCDISITLMIPVPLV